MLAPFPSRSGKIFISSLKGPFCPYEIRHVFYIQPDPNFPIPQNSPFDFSVPQRQKEIIVSSTEASSRPPSHRRRHQLGRKMECYTAEDLKGEKSIIQRESDGEIVVEFTKGKKRLLLSEYLEKSSQILEQEKKSNPVPIESFEFNTGKCDASLEGKTREQKPIDDAVLKWVAKRRAKLRLEWNIMTENDTKANTSPLSPFHYSPSSSMEASRNFRSSDFLSESAGKIERDAVKMVSWRQVGTSIVFGFNNGKFEQHSIFSYDGPLTKTRIPILTKFEKRKEAYRKKTPDNTWKPPHFEDCRLLQEEHADDPWKVEIICMLLNRTAGGQVKAVISNFFDLCPDAETCAQVPVDEITKKITHLGLQNTRARNIKLFSLGYLQDTWTHITELPGIDRYAADAYAIICTGRWKDVIPMDNKLIPYWKALHNNTVHN